MTSTNDGKDVKSNQTSGHKGKKYYIDLYNSLEARLSSESELHERTQHLCEAWSRIHRICRHALPVSHPLLLGWLEKHTSRIVLLTEWQSPTSKDEHTAFTQALDGIIEEIEAAVKDRHGNRLPWEIQLRARAEWFKGMLANPWDHSVLRVLLDPRGTPPSDIDVLEWLKGERDIVFMMRLCQLVASKCDDLAMSLTTAVLDRVRAAREVVPDIEQAEEYKDKPPLENKEPTFEDTLRAQAGFNDDTWALLTDIELVLLHKGDRRSRCIDLAKQTPLRNGHEVVQRLQKRFENAKTSRDKKLWKNATEVATIVAQVVIARCMVLPTCLGVVRTALFCTARALAPLLGAGALRRAAVALAAPAATATHLYWLARAVRVQKNVDEIKPFVCELYVRAITFGMNELEKLKLNTKKASDSRATERTLATWFLELGALFTATRFECECTLTAFSVHPTPEMYEKIKRAFALPATLPPVPVDNQELKQETTSEFGSWATDSRTHTKFVKTSETLNLKQTQYQTNVLSTAILTEGEGLGLGVELCQDLVVLLSGPRVKTLSWDMDRNLLLENCRSYMERTNCGTKALTTELKYLNLDPRAFQHLPEEEDDDGDIYYGIEKGYEHLVEFQEPQPEAIWDDDLWDDEEQTETASSSSTDSDHTTITRKKKVKHRSYSSDNESDPLSLVAESKRSEKKKERPHSKERSKEKRKPKKERSRSKEKKEKKERKKKEKADKQSDGKFGPLSSLIGIKVARVSKILAAGERKDSTKVHNVYVTDSDYDSQGKSSLNSEGNDHDIVYDGQFSMDELKSPEKELPQKTNLKNRELSIANGEVGINKTTKPTHTAGTSLDKKVPMLPSNAPVVGHKPEPNMVVHNFNDDIKSRISKLISFRRQKSSVSEGSSALTPPVAPATPKPQTANFTTDMTALIGAKVFKPEDVPKLTMNKEQTQQLSVLATEVNSLLSVPNSTNTMRPPGIKNNIYMDKFFVNNVAKTCSRTQPFKYDSSKRKATLPIQPNNSTENTPKQLSEKPVIDNTSPFSPQPQRTVTIPPVQPAFDRHQKSFQDFLKELQESLKMEAQTDQKPSKPKAKKELKPKNKVTPVVPNATKPEPTASPRCAKPLVQPKKENAPNTFARLNYMKQNQTQQKQNETNVKQSIDPVEQSRAALHDSISAELDQRIADLRLNNLKYLSDKGLTISKANNTAHTAKPKETPRVEVQKIEQMSPAALITEYPLLSNMLNVSLSSLPKRPSSKAENYTTNMNLGQPRIQTPKPTSSSLSEKDQLDLLLLLRQQNKLNAPVELTRMVTNVTSPTIQTRVDSKFNTPLTQTRTESKNNSSATPSVMEFKHNAPISQARMGSKHNSPATPIVMEFKHNSPVSETRMESKHNSSVTHARMITQTKMDSKLNSPVTQMRSESLPNSPTMHTRMETKHSAPITQTRMETGHATLIQTIGESSTNKTMNTIPLAVSSTPVQHENNNKIPFISNKTLLQNADNQNKLNTLQQFKRMERVVYSPNQINPDPNTTQNTVFSMGKEDALIGKKVTENKQDWASVLDEIRQHKTPSRGPNALEMFMKKDSYEKYEKGLTQSRRTVKINTANVTQTTKTTSGTNVFETTPKPKSILLAPPNKAVVVKQPNVPKKQIQIEVKNSNQVQKKLVDVPRKIACGLQKEDDPFISGIPNSDYDLLEELMDEDLRQEIGELSSDEERFDTAPATVAKVLKNSANVKFTVNAINKPVSTASTNQKSDIAVNQHSMLNTQNDREANKAAIDYTKPKSNNQIKILNTTIIKTPVSGLTISKTKPQINNRIKGHKLTENSVALRTTVAPQTPKMTAPCSKNQSRSIYNINIATNNLVQQPKIDPTKVFITAVPQPAIQNVVVVGTDFYDPYSALKPVQEKQISAGECSATQNALVVNDAPSVTVFEAPQFTTVASPIILANTITLPIPTNTVSTTKISVPLSIDRSITSTQTDVLRQINQASVPSNQSDLSTAPLQNKIKDTVSMTSLQNKLKETISTTSLQNKLKDTVVRTDNRSDLSTTPLQNKLKETVVRTDVNKRHGPSKSNSEITTTMPVDINTKLESRLPLESNLSKTCERKVLSQVQEKLKTITERVDHRNNQLLTVNNVKKHNLKEMERISKKRLAIINREINHRCFYPPIPLTYIPLKTNKVTQTTTYNKKTELDKAKLKMKAVKTVQDSNLPTIVPTGFKSSEMINATTPVTTLVNVNNTEIVNENSKENKDGTSSCHNISLPLSNILKSTPTNSKKVLGRKMKVRLKSAACESTKREDKSDTAIDKTTIDFEKDTETNKKIEALKGRKPKIDNIRKDDTSTPIRTSTRIRERKNKTPKEIEESATKVIPAKKTDETLSEVEINKTVEVIDNIVNGSDNDIFDIEDALTVVKICKPENLSTEVNNSETLWKAKSNSIKTYLIAEIKNTDDINDTSKYPSDKYHLEKTDPLPETRKAKEDVTLDSFEKMKEYEELKANPPIEKSHLEKTKTVGKNKSLLVTKINDGSTMNLTPEINKSGEVQHISEDSKVICTSEISHLEKDMPVPEDKPLPETKSEEDAIMSTIQDIDKNEDVQLMSSDITASLVKSYYEKTDTLPIATSTEHSTLNLTPIVKDNETQDISIDDTSSKSLLEKTEAMAEDNCLLKTTSKEDSTLDLTLEINKNVVPEDINICTKPEKSHSEKSQIVTKDETLAEPINNDLRVNYTPKIKENQEVQVVSNDTKVTLPLEQSRLDHTSKPHCETVVDKSVVSSLSDETHSYEEDLEMICESEEPRKIQSVSKDSIIKARTRHSINSTTVKHSDSKNKKSSVNEIKSSNTKHSSSATKALDNKPKLTSNLHSVNEVQKDTGSPYSELMHKSNISTIVSDSKTIQDSQTIDSKSDICYEKGTPESTVTLPIQANQSDMTQNNNDVIAIDSEPEQRENLNAIKTMCERLRTEMNLEEKPERTNLQEKPENTHISMENHDIPESYKSSISIQELPLPNPENPFKRCVRIKLPNGKIYKATVYGTMTVSFDSLFANPALKNILMSGFSDKKRYTLSVQQLATSSNNIVDTRVREIGGQSISNTVETVNLISDDEEDDVLQKFTTEFGKFPVRSIDKDTFTKHQSKFSQKCLLKLNKCSSKQDSSTTKAIKSDTKPNEEHYVIPEELNSSILTDTLPEEKEANNVLKNVVGAILTDAIDSKEIIQLELPQESTKNLKVIPDVIEIDDSSNDSVIVPDVSNTQPAAPKIDEFRNLLLRDLGVDDIFKDAAVPNIPPNNDPIEKRPSFRNRRKVQRNSKSKININSATKDDYTYIIQRKYFVNLFRCDEVLKKFNIRDNEENTTAADVKISDSEDVGTKHKTAADIQKSDVEDVVTENTTAAGIQKSEVEDVIAEKSTAADVQIFNIEDVTENTKAVDVQISDVECVVTENKMAADVQISHLEHGVTEGTCKADLNRSRSYSILNNIENDNVIIPELDSDAGGRSSPVIDIFETISTLHGVQENDRNSPVMEVFDMIAYLINKVSDNPDPQHVNFTVAPTCYSDWFETKRSLHCKIMKPLSIDVDVSESIALMDVLTDHESDHEEILNLDVIEHVRCDSEWLMTKMNLHRLSLIGEEHNVKQGHDLEMVITENEIDTSTDCDSDMSISLLNTSECNLPVSGLTELSTCYSDWFDTKLILHHRSLIPLVNKPLSVESDVPALTKYTIHKENDQYTDCESDYNDPTPLKNTDHEVIVVPSLLNIILKYFEDKPIVYQMKHICKHTNDSVTSLSHRLKRKFTDVSETGTVRNIAIDCKKARVYVAELEHHAASESHLNSDNSEIDFDNLKDKSLEVEQLTYSDVEYDKVNEIETSDPIDQIRNECQNVKLLEDSIISNEADIQPIDVANNIEKMVNEKDNNIKNDDCTISDIMELEKDGPVSLECVQENNGVCAANDMTEMFNQNQLMDSKGIETDENRRDSINCVLGENSKISQLDKLDVAFIDNNTKPNVEINNKEVYNDYTKDIVMDIYSNSSNEALDIAIDNLQAATHVQKQESNNRCITVLPEENNEIFKQDETKFNVTPVVAETGIEDDLENIIYVNNSVVPVEVITEEKERAHETIFDITPVPSDNGIVKLLENVSNINNCIVPEEVLTEEKETEFDVTPVVTDTGIVEHLENMSNENNCTVLEEIAEKGKADDDHNSSVVERSIIMPKQKQAASVDDSGVMPKESLQASEDNFEILEQEQLSINQCSLASHECSSDSSVVFIENVNIDENRYVCDTEVDIEAISNSDSLFDQIYPNDVNAEEIIETIDYAVDITLTSNKQCDDTIESVVNVSAKHEEPNATVVIDTLQDIKQNHNIVNVEEMSKTLDDLGEQNKEAVESVVVVSTEHEDEDTAIKTAVTNNLENVNCLEVVKENHNIIPKEVSDVDENVLEENVTLVYKDDSGVVLKGIEYEDPEIGTCYVFPLAKNSVTSASSDVINSNSESMVEVIQQIDDDEQNPSNDLCDEIELQVVAPKVTYYKRNRKRKANMRDVDGNEKKNKKGSNNVQRYRKSKNIDSPKITSAAMSESFYGKEYKRLVDYYAAVKFSYSVPFHKVDIDVPELITNWPINGQYNNDIQKEDEINNPLFVDVEAITKPSDPMEQTLAEELSADYCEDFSSSQINETNFSTGFGERSGRVIQNLVDGGSISQFSAATLSDVKQPQPFLLSEDYDDCESNQNILNSNDDQIEKIKRYTTYLRLRDKVRSFFKKTTVELSRELIKQQTKDKIHKGKIDSSTFPFDLYIRNGIVPSPTKTVVQVVQVGQLPVSAAAQNPVTCDPRVTQVSDASPSQCSVENSPHDDSQQGIKTEYTELTTADLSMPLVQDYAQHNQSINMEAQEGSNVSMTNENIPIETELIKSEVKIELVEETPEDKDEHSKSPDAINLDDEAQAMADEHVNNIEYSYEMNNTNSSVESDQNVQILFTSADKQDISESFSQHKQNGSSEKTDQIAHAMNAAGITTTSETINNTRAHALVNILSQKIRHGAVSTTQNSPNTYPKATSINAMALQQALAQILPPPLNQTSSAENNQQAQNSQVTPQVLHIVQGKNASGNQITLVDNTQQSVISTPNATPVLHIVQNKAAAGGPTSNGNPSQQQNAFSGLSLVDTGLQQGGNQLLHIVNTGNQKNNNAGQLLKRVNLLTNLANVQGSNEQKMVQFVCKSADGKAIQLNAPHQRSMVLRLQPIETPNVQATPPKPIETQDLSPTPTAVNSAPSKESAATQQEIKSRSVYEENYAKFIQNSSSKPSVLEKSTSLPKFNQAFGKPVFQAGNQKQNEISNNNSHLQSVNTNTETNESQPTENAINLENIGQISSPPLLLRKSPAQTSQAQHNLVQQIKQTITPMNIQTMHGGVIYTRQIPVNIGGGQTINLITVPSTDLLDDTCQKQATEVKFVNQGEIENSIIKIVPQSQPTPNAEVSPDDSHINVNNENAQNPQPQPVLTQMRIKLPMLSKTPQMVSGARVVRPSFFQIQRNVIGGANQPVYQQLVLTAAPPLGQQTIRLPQAQTSRQIKVPSENQSSESQMSTSTLEQLREFDMVLEQVKERSTVQPNANSTSSFKLHTPATDTTDSPASVSSTPTETTQQVLYSIGGTQSLNVAYVNRKATVTTPTTSTFVRSPDSSGIADSPTSSTHVQIPHTVTAESSPTETPVQQKPAKVGSKSKSRPKSSSNPPNSMKINTVPPKTSAQKPLEDEQTTQRILYILAEYKEQVENSPDKDKPAPRRRSNPPSNPSGNSKRKKSSSGSRRPGARDMSPVHGDDTCRTMGSEDSSCGTSQGDCTENCQETHSPQDSPRKVVRKLTFEQEAALNQPRPQPQRNVIVADGQTITVARGAAGKPATAVLMPANYILPVSMVKGGQQIAIVTNRGPKLLTVGGGEGGATNALLLQRLIGPAGLKPVLARPGVRHVRLPTAALHNLQAFNLATTTTVQPPDSTASPAPEPTPPELVETGAESSPWTDRESESAKPSDRASSPEGSEPWNLPSSADPHDYTYEETVRAENMDRTVLVVQKKDGSSQRQHRLTHVSAAALRHKYAILEHELRLQKSLSEECEDLGVDSPSASELFPEAELLFAASPAHDHAQEATNHSHTPQPLLNQSSIQPDIDDQIATDQLLPREDIPQERQDLDVNLGLEDVGIVTVSEDGMQATITLDQEEFARSHPNTTFHSEPTEEGEVQPFTISGLKGRHVTSTIFHSRAPATVLMTAPQATVISQAAAEGNSQSSVKYDLDNMINSIPGTHSNNINFSSVMVKDDGLTRFDNILTDSRELHLSNTASAIVHSAGNATQVIRRVCYDEDKRERERFLIDEPDALIAGDDAKMIAEDSSRDATMESMTGDVDDGNSSPERHAELFWESNSASERSESRRPLDFSSDSDKCCKSPSFDETNSTDSSGVGTHMRLDSVIKEARGIERSGSADGSSADDTLPPLRTYPPKRPYNPSEGEMERSLSGKTRAGERSPDSLEVRRRASGRGVVKRGCHCCNGSPAPQRPKKPRQRKPTMDFNTNN